MIGERVLLARRAAGLSLRDLAERVGLSAMAISKYETGKATPSSKTLIDLAKALEVSTEYFLRPQRVELKLLKFRKHPGLLEGPMKKIEARAVERVERFHELAERFPNQPFERFEIPIRLPDSIEDYSEIEAITESLRKAWKLGCSPIPDLTNVLERNGIRVFQCPIEDSVDKFSGLAAAVDGMPIVVVALEHPGDRQRFTLAHELGHLILDKIKLGKKLNLEKAADRFAGAFIVPAEAAISRLGERRSSLEPRELWLLKQEFGMSMVGWILRARDLGVISYPVYLETWKHFDSHGWTKKEPFEDLPRERPQLFEQLIFRALSDDLIGESKAAELMGISMLELRKLRNMERAGAGRK